METINYKDIYNYSIGDLFEKVMIKYKNNTLSFEEFLQKYFIENGLDEFISKLYDNKYFDYQIDYNKFINDLLTNNFPNDFDVELLNYTEIFYKNNMLLFNEFIISYVNDNNDINIINKLIDLKYNFPKIEYNKKIADIILNPDIISKKIVDYFYDELCEYIKYNGNDEKIAIKLIEYGVKNVKIDYKKFVNNLYIMDLEMIYSLNIKYYDNFYKIDAFVEDFINDKNEKLVEECLEYLLLKKYPIDKKLFLQCNSNYLLKWYINRRL